VPAPKGGQTGEHVDKSGTSAPHSDQSAAQGADPLTSLALRLDGSLHQKVQSLAEIEGVSVTEYIRRAIRERVDSQLSDPEWQDVSMHLKKLRSRLAAKH
jgi:hypothetical protein